MKILDNNALNYVVEHHIILDEPCFVTPDVQDEYEAGTDDALPTNVQPCAAGGSFDEGLYLQHYKKMLNSYGDRSFFNMRGFGDISILALLHTLKDTTAGLLPTLLDPVTVVTGDGKLTEAIQTQFGSSAEFDQKLIVDTPGQHFDT